MPGRSYALRMCHMHDTKYQRPIATLLPQVRKIRHTKDAVLLQEVELAITGFAIFHTQSENPSPLTTVWSKLNN